MNDALIILKKAPYGRVFSVEGIRLASGLAAMDVTTTMVLVGDAVYSIVRDQDTSSIGMPPLVGGFTILEMSEVPVLAIREDLEERGLQQSNLREYPFLQVITRKEFARRVAEASCSFRF